VEFQPVIKHLDPVNPTLLHTQLVGRSLNISVLDVPAIAARPPILSIADPNHASLILVFPALRAPMPGSLAAAFPAPDHAGKGIFIRPSV
jgi:hypothetical protein